MPYAAVWMGGVFNPFVKELRETQYQFRAPYVMDSTRAQEYFAIAPATIEESVRADLENSARHL